MRAQGLGGLEKDGLPHILQKGAGRAVVPHSAEILADAGETAETLLQLAVQRVVHPLDLGDPAAVRVQGDFGLLGGLTGGEVQSVQLQRPGGEAELGQGYRVLAHAQTDTRPG